jgi:hypothetical protein
MSLDVENIIFQTIIMILLRALWRQLATGSFALPKMNDQYIDNCITELAKRYDRDTLFKAIKNKLVDCFSDQKCNSDRYEMFAFDMKEDFKRWFEMKSTNFTVTKHLKNIYDNYLVYLLLFLYEIQVDCDCCDEDSSVGDTGIGEESSTDEYDIFL